MATIFGYLKSAWQKRVSSAGLNPAVLLPSLVLITLLLPFKYNSLAVIAFTAWSFCTTDRRSARFSIRLLYPLLLFTLMCVSWFWSADTEATASGLVRELPLAVLPLAFMLKPVPHRVLAGRILHYFSISMTGFGLYYILKAVIRYFFTGDTGVFYYHELAGDNAIYVSAVFSLALFYFAGLREKRLWHYIAAGFMVICIILLASKTVVLIDITIIAGYFFFSAALKPLYKAGVVAAFLLTALVLGYNSKIKDRIMQEYASNTSATSEYISNGSSAGYVYDVSMKDAWCRPSFTPGDRFTGTSFRVYQARVFAELLEEDLGWWKGYGLNASQPAIARKDREHNVFMGSGELQGYHTMNFHNQYTQVFAELGIAGFVILLLMLFFNLKNSIKVKDFVHIAFSILMIALFLTESFIWRQRGVVFFTILYCLFNTIAEKERKTI